MADGGLIGSLDVTPPTGQTFAHIKVWTDLWGEYGAFVEGAETNAKGWWDAAALFRGYVDALDAVAADFQKILSEMGAKFTGAAAEALVARGNEIVKHVMAVANQVRGYPTVVDNTGHDIKVYSVAFWEAHAYFHRMTQMEEDKITTRIQEITQGTGMPQGDIDKLVDEGRQAAYQMVEQNYMIPHQRKLLMILAGKYASKHAALMPIDIRMDELATVSDGSGNDSGSNNKSNNKSGNGSGNNNDDSDSGSGDGSGSGSDADLNSDKKTGGGSGGPSANDLGAGSGSGSGSGGPTGGGTGSSGGGGSPSGKSAGDAAKAANDAIDAMKGAGTGGSGSPESGGAGSGSPESGGAGSGSPGSGMGSGSPGSGSKPGGSGSGSDGDRSKALKDAEDAANKAIDDLMGGGSGAGSGSGGGKKPPTSSAGPDAQERDQALQDAKDAADKAIDDLLGGNGSGQGSGIPTTSDPEARERVDALEDAREAVDDAIGDLIDKNEASDADPHDKEVRRQALADAQDAADDAIEDLVKAQAGGDSPNALRQDAIDDADTAVDEALGDLDDNGSKVRQDALDDAQTATDDVMDDLRDDAPDQGLTTEQEIHDDALGDAKRDLTSKFDRLVNETLDDKALSDGDKLARVDALNDAKNAALGAVDDVIASSARGGQSELARFLGPPPSASASGQAGGGSGGGSGGGGGGGANTPSGQAVHLANPGGGGPVGDTGSGAPMRLDAAQGSANQGMPMAPPMGGMGAGGQQQRERDRASWLEGESDVWVDDEELSGRAIGRQPPS